MEGSSGSLLRATTKAAAYIFGLPLGVAGPFGMAVIAGALVIGVEFVRWLVGLH